MMGSFVQVVVISRALDLDEAGMVFLVFTLVSLAATVGRFGTDNLVLRMIASRQTGYSVEARWLAWTCWVTSSFSGSIIFVLLCSGLLPASLHGLTVLDAVCAGAMTVFYSVGVFAGAVLRGSGRLVAGIAAELGIAPWVTAALVVGLQVTGVSTVTTVLFSFLISGLLTALWASHAAHPFLGADDNASWRSGMAFLRVHLGSLASLMGTSLLFFALVWVPQLSLGVVGTATQVAEYTAAARLASFITIFPGIQTSYLGPRFAALAHSDRRLEISSQSGRATISAMLVAVPILIVTSAVPQQLLGVFGGGYVNAAIPTLILCIGAYIGVAFGPVNVIMMTAGLEKFALILNACLLTALTTVILVWTSELGVTGIAIACAAGTVLYGALASVLIWCNLRVDPTLLAYFRPTVLASGTIGTSKRVVQC